MRWAYSISALLVKVAFVGILITSNAIPVKAASYAVNVYLPTTQMQAQFIADTTAQYSGIVKAGAFQNYSVTVSSRNPEPDSLFFPDNYSYGFSAGMDEERWQDMKLINFLMQSDAAEGTCGSYVITESTEAMFNICQKSYNDAIGIIGQRWQSVFTSSGAIVIP